MNVTKALWAIFGAHGQIIVGVLATLVGIGAWAYWSLISAPTVAVVFHVSMFFGVVACYSIIATALGYRATERVEAQVAEVDHADQVIEQGG